MKRDWYIALCDVTGHFAANPASFEAATIYGPYTKDQADQADELGEQFPDESWVVVVFKANERPPFRSLMKLLKERVAEALADDKEKYDRQDQIRANPLEEW